MTAGQSINAPQMAQQHNNLNGKLAPLTKTQPLVKIESLSSFILSQQHQFNISLDQQCNPDGLKIKVFNPITGHLECKLNWLDVPDSNNDVANHNSSYYNKCVASFFAPIVGLYTIDVTHSDYSECNTQFTTKAYDLTKVLIHKTSDTCRVNDRYEFSVDASEAGEGQLEIAVNEGEIPNQVQVLNNGKCIVNFVPEESVAHVVDIKFNGHNVNGCPFIVQVTDSLKEKNAISSIDPKQSSVKSTKSESKSDHDIVNYEPVLNKNERIMVDTCATFSLENIDLSPNELKDILVIDPDCHPINCKIISTPSNDKFNYTYEFKPVIVGDHIVEIKPKSYLVDKLPQYITQQFPFPLKVFDYSKVIVSGVTDGVVNNPIYFFIDASQAGSGNLEIRVSSSSGNVANYPESEANAKIRVNFTPTEAIDHIIDIKFNGFSVPNNPFHVKVYRSSQGRLSEPIPKYVSIDQKSTFFIEYINSKQDDLTKLTSDCCKVGLLKSDYSYIELDDIELVTTKDPESCEEKAKFKINFQQNKIGPYKLFPRVNNQLLPSSPTIINVCNINEVKVNFAQQSPNINNISNTKSKPVAQLKKPITFTVDASRAGEGLLALVVLSGISQTPNEVKVSDQGHGLYELTFVPTEFAPHSIDISFNEQCVPDSPFIIDVIDSSGNLATDEELKNKIPIVSDDNNKSDTNNESCSNEETTKLTKNSDSKLSRDLENGVEKYTETSPYHDIATTSKKSLAYGLVNASNIVYLESGVLENSANQISLVGPSGKKVPFVLGRGSPQKGEPKKTYIEYKPTDIGTHVINVLESGKNLRQYFVETCDPSLAKVIGLDDSQRYIPKQPIKFLIDSNKSGEIQLDNIHIIGPKNRIKDGDNTIMGRIRSISSSGGSSSQNPPLDCSILRINDHQYEITFLPQHSGKHLIHIRCLGQPVGNSPYEIDVMDVKSPVPNVNGKFLSDEEILLNVVVHGVSLKCSPVNSTGAFIIETYRNAHARDFDVFIADPSKSLVDVQCYLQQDGNLLAEWIPRRVGAHEIQVLYKDNHVPGSPFITEAFDPSGVVIDKILRTTVNVNEKVEFTIDRKQAGNGELDVAISSPVGQDLPIEVKKLRDSDQLGELISFVPPVAGQYKLSILFGGFEVPKSPISITVKDNDYDPITIFGQGLQFAEINRTSQFIIESSKEGQLKIKIRSSNEDIVPRIERSDVESKYIVKYKPTSVGLAAISVFWNGSQVDNSPFNVPVNDLTKISFVGSEGISRDISNNQRFYRYEVNKPVEISVDTSQCGPGDLVAEAYCRANLSLKFPLVTKRIAENRYLITFIWPPKSDQPNINIKSDDASTQTTYIVRFHYNNLSVPDQCASVILSPSVDTKTDSSNLFNSEKLRSTNSNIVNDGNNNNNSKYDSTHSKDVLSELDDRVACPIVSLRGHGLAEATTGERAEFTINGSKAGPGEPKVTLNSRDNGNIDVQLSKIDVNIYQAHYIANQPGQYTLNVLWGGKQVAGCPISVNVKSNCDPSKVLCTGDGLKGGILGEEIKILVDTRRAGHGELTALCTGQQKVALCELLDRGDGTFILYIKPQEAGRQFLSIKYAGQHIPKSPFMIKVSGKPDPSKVRVHGPGVEHGVLSLYQSRFVCDTRGAGAGQLTVRIRGPKGAFRMETQRESQRDRTILCKYDPTEPGDYRIEIKWSGHHVPGSPFHVMIFDTQEELKRFLSGVPPFYYNYL